MTRTILLGKTYSVTAALIAFAAIHARCAPTSGTTTDTVSAALSATQRVITTAQPAAQGNGISSVLTGVQEQVPMIFDEWRCSTISPVFPPTDEINPVHSCRVSEAYPYRWSWDLDPSLAWLCLNGPPRVEDEIELMVSPDIFLNGSSNLAISINYHNDQGGCTQRQPCPGETFVAVVDRRLLAENLGTLGPFKVARHEHRRFFYALLYAGEQLEGVYYDASLVQNTTTAKVVDDPIVLTNLDGVEAVNIVFLDTRSCTTLHNITTWRNITCHGWLDDPFAVGAASNDGTSSDATRAAQAAVTDSSAAAATTTTTTNTNSLPVTEAALIPNVTSHLAAAANASPPLIMDRAREEIAPLFDLPPLPLFSGSWSPSLSLGEQRGRGCGEDSQAPSPARAMCTWDGGFQIEPGVCQSAQPEQPEPFNPTGQPVQTAEPTEPGGSGQPKMLLSKTAFVASISILGAISAITIMSMAAAYLRQRCSCSRS